MTDSGKKRIKQQRKVRRNKRRRIALIGIPVAVLIVVILILVSGDSNSEQSEQSNVPVQDTVIELAFAGDLNITDAVVEAGATDSGYNYSEVFKDILPLLAGADQTALNFEGNLCGAPYGSEKTSSPPELLNALSSAGVDLLQVANSCTINNGLLGLGETLNSIRSTGMEPLGAYASPKEFQQNRGFVLREIQGIKVAFVAFTKGMDNIALPSGQEDCVNLLYSDYTSTYQKVDTAGITKILQSVAAEDPDLTIAMLHWGSEFNTQISSSQKKIVKLMKSEGVDAIIGSHSHQLQQIDYDEKSGNLIAYSLGDLLGDADRSASAYSAILKLQITKNGQTGKTRITGYEYEPIYTYRQQTESGVSTTILRMKPAIEDYEAKGINAVPEDAYNAMKSALSKVEMLMAPLEEESA